MATEKETKKRYATRFGHHYSIIMIPTTVEVVNGIAVNKPGKTIEFDSGIYETSDPKEQKFLETSPQFGRDYREVTREVDGAIQTKSLEDKEKELQEKEDELKRREMALKGHEEGAKTPAPKKEDKEDDDKKDEGEGEKKTEGSKTGTGARF